MLVKLKDIGKVVTGKTPSTKDHSLWDGNVCFITIEDIKNNPFIKDTVRYISNSGFSTIKNNTISGTSILVNCVGDIGEVGITTLTCATNQQINSITEIKEFCNPYFLYYKLKTFKQKMDNIAGQTVLKILPKTVFENIEIDLPSIETQDKIANILLSIDNQIERNNAMSKRLQVLAQTTYSRWFNQFEFQNNEGKPYKSDGGELVYNKELGKEIPKDWSIDNLYKIASFENGLACQKFRPLNDIDKLPVIKITEMHNGFTKETEFCRNDVAQKHIINNGDLLFSWSATLETQIWCGGKGVLNQHIFNVIPKEYFSKYYVYLQLTNYIQNFVKIAESRKTTMGHITTDHLKQSRIIVPPNDVINKFTALTNPIYSEIINLNIENIKLITLKEKLLPLLVNGQLNI